MKLPAFIGIANPFEPERFVSREAPQQNEKFLAYLERVGFTTKYKILCYKNGEMLEQNAELCPTDTLRVVACVGGGDSSDPLSIILTVATLVASVYFAPALATTLGIKEALAGGLIGLGGLLVTSLIVGPPKLPSLPNIPDQNYNELFGLTGATNVEARYEPMQVVLGRHRLLPALGASPYTTFEGDEQYLNVIYHFGLGRLNITERSIGTTPLDSYDEVQRESIDGGRVSLVALDVLTISGATNIDVGDQVVRELAGNGEKIQFDVVYRAFRIANNGAYATTHIRLRFEWRKVGSATWNSLEDVVLESEDLNTYRRTFSYDVENAEAIEVRITRLTDGISNSMPDNDDMFEERSVERDVGVPNIRLFQRDTRAADYDRENRDALIIRASGQLSGAVPQYHAIVEQIVPVLTNGVWDNTVSTFIDGHSNNPAAVFRFVCIGETDRQGNRIYGANITALHEASIQAWYQYCLEQGFTFNYVQQTDESLDVVLRRICTAGRASPQFYGMQLGVVYDNEGAVPQALYTADNMILRSYNVTYQTDNNAQGVVARFINPNNDWQTDEIRTTIPGVTQPVNEVVVTLEGITDREQASRAANLIIAENVYHTGTYSFETDTQGRLTNRGDVIMIAPPFVDNSGRVQGFDSSTNIIDLGKPLDIREGGRLLVRSVDNELVQFDIAAGNVLSGGDFTIFNASNKTDLIWHYFFDGTTREVQVVEVTYSGLDRVKISARDFNPDFYRYKDNPVIFSGVTSSRRVLEINNIDHKARWIFFNGRYSRRVVLSFSVNGNYEWIRLFNSGVYLTEIRQTNTVSFDIPDTVVGVYTLTLLSDTGAYYNYSIPYETNELTPSPITSIRAVECAACLKLGVEHETIGDIKGYAFKWSLTSEDTDNWDTMLPFHEGLITELPAVFTQYIDRAFLVGVRAQNLAGNWSPVTFARLAGFAPSANVFLEHDLSSDGYATSELTNFLRLPENNLTFSSNNTWQTFASTWSDADNWIGRAAKYSTITLDNQSVDVYGIVVSPTYRVEGRHRYRILITGSVVGYNVNVETNIDNTMWQPTTEQSILDSSRSLQFRISFHTPAGATAREAVIIEGILVEITNV